MTATTNLPTLLSARDVARVLGVSRDTVYRLRASGRLRALRFVERGPLRFDPDDVRRLIEKGRTRA